MKGRFCGYIVSMEFGEWVLPPPTWKIEVEVSGVRYMKKVWSFFRKSDRGFKVGDFVIVNLGSGSIKPGINKNSL